MRAKKGKGIEAETAKSKSAPIERTAERFGELLARARRADAHGSFFRLRYRRRTALAIGLFLLVLLAADLVASNAIFNGEPYVLAVVASAWLQRRSATILVTVFATLFLLLGHLFGPQAADELHALTERGVATGLVWLTTALVVLLLRANRRFQLALEAMPTPVLLASEAGSILLANSRAERLFGYPSGALVERSVVDLVPERFRERFQAGQRELLAEEKHEQGVTRELVTRKDDGSEVPVEVTIHRLDTSRGAVLLLALRDLSRRRSLEIEKDRLAAIVQTSSDAIVSVSIDGVVTSWNAGANAIYGYASEEMIGLPLYVLAPDEHEAEVRRLLETLGTGARVRQLESEHVDKDGQRLRVALSASPIRSAEGRIVGAAMIARDVTAEKRSEALLLEMNLALTNAMPGHAYVSPEGQIALANEALTELLGTNGTRGQEDWRRAFHAEDRAALDASYEAMLKQGKAELTVHSEQAEARWFDVLLVKRAGPGSVFQGHHLFVKDVTSRERAEAELRRLAEELERSNDDLAHLAEIDPLTGLLNRRGLERYLSGEAHRARREGTTLVAMIVDLDDFKSVNERHGHHGGDLALKAVAERIQRALRAYDGAARIGGDEFLLVLPGTRPGEAKRVAERLRTSVASESVQIAGSEGGEPAEVHVTCSLGLAEVPERAPSIPGLLVRTRAALERAKHEGKNRVSVQGFDAPEAGTEELLDIIDSELVMIAEQPIFDLLDDRIVAHELLARGPSGPYEAAEDFFAASAARELLPRADLACLRRAVLASRALPPEHRLHLNVFPETLLEGHLQEVLDILATLPADRSVCIELNDHAFVGDPGSMRTAVAALREAGHQIALDDVGFGKSALETLAVLEPEIVKIDRRVVTGASGNAGRARTLDRLLGVAHGLRALPIAEGIEDAADRELLTRLGVRFAQGFALGQPTLLLGSADRDVLTPFRAPSEPAGREAVRRAHHDRSAEQRPDRPDR